jgi:hypothetical protein
LAPERKVLATRFQDRNEKLAVLCLYRLQKFAAGIEAVGGMSGRKAFTPFRAELRLLLAMGHEGLGEWKTAESHYREVPGLSPKTAVAAEAFYRLASHYLEVLGLEDSARVLFDSAAAAGQTYEYGKLGAEKAAALSRLAELRKAPPPDSSQPHYRDFMMAELFLFRLDQVDSALVRLDRIVASPQTDTAHTLRAAYARAFIQEEFLLDKAKSDSLYRFVLDSFPGTDWAKQAEKNLGLKPTVETREDQAHAKFLAAEELRFAGEDFQATVIPAYREVAALYPGSRHAAKALFVVAMLGENLAQREPPAEGALDSAKAAYRELAERYPGTPYARIAGDKLSAAGASAPAAPPSGPAGKAPPAKTQEVMESDPPRADPRSQKQPPIPETAPAAVEMPPADSVAAPAKPHREVLEPNYEDVDQY